MNCPIKPSRCARTALTEATGCIICLCHSRNSILCNNIFFVLRYRYEVHNCCRQCQFACDTREHGLANIELTLGEWSTPEVNNSMIKRFDLIFSGQERICTAHREPTKKLLKKCCSGESVDQAELQRPKYLSPLTTTRTNCILLIYNIRTEIPFAVRS
jgi:hypothetical protein